MPRKKGLIALLGFVVFFIICAYTFHPHLPSIPIYPVARAQWEASEKVVAVVPPTPSSVRIYIGVVSNRSFVYLIAKVTAWWNFAARSILREAYTHFRIDRNDVVTIRFIVGLPGEDENGMMDLLHWEQDRFGDLQVLNQRENINEGKTFEYFSSLARMYPAEDPQQRPYDYAMKADDDTFVNIPLLLERLRPMTPREDSYIGRGTDYWHMGAGYILSWDLVRWIEASKDDHPYYIQWPEDQAIGEMLRAGDRGHNFVNLKEQVMDHPAGDWTDWTREFGDDVILVHRLKDVPKKGDAIGFFLGSKENRRERH